MPRKRVVVAMSGGVDSSVTAALLKQAGYEVWGIHVLMSPYQPSPSPALSVLENTCQLLNIPLQILNLEEQFQNLVIDYFCQEYGRGRTPNLCILCNRFIKFGRLLDKALEMGADYLATGHYARIEHSQDGYRLLKGVDPNKDQSYFLYTLGQRELQYLMLPLGDYHKTEVRRLAAELGLPAASRPSSHDLCFIPGTDYRSFVADHTKLEPGDIVDIDGKVLGRHGGLARYTIGQRQGLGLASGKRLYVLKLDAATNSVMVGTKDQLLKKALRTRKLTWVSGKAPAEPIDITAKIRYRSPEAHARLCPSDGMAEVQFYTPQSAITPGQSVVFYQGDAVMGGGVIEDAE